MNRNTNDEINKFLSKMIDKDWKNLQYVDEEYQTEDLCIRAIRKNPQALKYIKNQTEAECLEAVKQDEKGIVLQFVKNKTPEIYFEAVKKNMLSLKYVDEITDEIALYVLKSNPEIAKRAIKFISNML